LRPSRLAPRLFRATGFAGELNRELPFFFPKNFHKNKKDVIITPVVF
jgi:hypothetical protein